MDRCVNIYFCRGVWDHFYLHFTSSLSFWIHGKKKLTRKMVPWRPQISRFTHVTVKKVWLLWYHVGDKRIEGEISNPVPNKNPSWEDHACILVSWFMLYEWCLQSSDDAHLVFDEMGENRFFLISWCPFGVWWIGSEKIPKNNFLLPFILIDK